MKKIEKRTPPPCARRAAARPRAKIAPLFWWGFLLGFLIVSRRRSERFRASVSARFLVMAKNSGGYFSITNFLTVSHGLRGCLLFRFASLLIVRHSRAVLAVSAAFCCAVCVFACLWLFRRLWGCFWRFYVVALLCLSLCVRLWRVLLLAVARLRGWSYVFPPALLSFVYGRFSAFCGVASDYIKKTPHGGGVVVRRLFEIFINRAEKFRYNGKQYIYYHRRLALFQLLPAIIAGL